ncbi:MAG TPA: response regulator transcription factor [Candidatus Elarobacter sp.]|nr:response regulator transcription factor [Candidatus Elarobacter sp.]
MRVLIVDGSVSAASRLRAMLHRRLFAVDIEHDGEAGLERLLGQLYDIAVIEAVLPKIDGFSIVRAAREHGVTTLIMMVTTRCRVEDRVRGLLSGADDYLVKPFADAELTARLNALSRRAIHRSRRVLVAVGELSLDVSAHAASYAGKIVDLSATEFRLLAFLARNAGTTFSRRQLLTHVWTHAFEGPTNVVDVCVGTIRRKLLRAGGAGVIETVHGIGYRVSPSTPMSAIC